MWVLEFSYESTERGMRSDRRGLLLLVLKVPITSKVGICIR